MNIHLIGPEIGFFALCQALILALIPLLVISKLVNIDEISQLSILRRTLTLQALFIFLAFACLLQAFCVDDFTVRYVAEHSNVHLPLCYKISAVWGAHEGSMLLWLLILMVWSQAAAAFSQALPVKIRCSLLQVLNLLIAGFLLFIILTSNPFLRLLPAPQTPGIELNPLLQDLGLILHPPILYLGYVGTAIPFALAVAALWQGELTSRFASWCRPWVLLSWSFLTVGITLGSWWAYRELGWGGFWFWDPVENASLMPWLLATALLHALMVMERSNEFRAWSMLLALGCFILSLLGTFLVRSGVLTSVHTFALDPSRGMAMLIYLTVVGFVSSALFAWRASQLSGQGQFAFLSRETTILLNNLIVLVMVLTLLLGTLYPLVLEILNLGKISVGPPYFNKIMVPLMSIMWLLMILVPACRWRSMSWVELWKQQRWWLIVLGAIALTLYVYFLCPTLQGSQLLLIALLFMLMSSQLLHLVQMVLRSGFAILRRAALPMWLAHSGVLLTSLGILTVTIAGLENFVEMQVQDQLQLGPYQITFLAERSLNQDNYHGVAAIFSAKELRTSKTVTIQAEKRIYNASGQTMTDAGIDAGFFRDIYISLGQPRGRQWTVRVYYKPGVRWIWAGGLLMALGGLWACIIRLKLQRGKSHE